MPPYTAWMPKGAAWPSRRASLAICTTSSRVGAMTSARGAAGRPGRSRARRRVKMVIRKAAVLPVPVCACPATSRPASASGRTFSWMGVQCVKPAARMPAATGPGRPKVVKLRPVRGVVGSAAAGAVESGITYPRPSGGGGRKSSRHRLDPRARNMEQNPRMSARPEAARIMLGFVVRQCAVALGHAPTPEELASWANEQGDVLVAGQQLGAGPGGGEAARALAAAGVIAVVAGSFAPGFAEALLAAGLPPLEVDAPAVFHTGQRMRLNLEAGTIANLSSGDRLPVRNLTEELVERLRALLAR